MQTLRKGKTLISFLLAYILYNSCKGKCVGEKKSEYTRNSDKKYEKTP